MSKNVEKTMTRKIIRRTKKEKSLLEEDRKKEQQEKEKEALAAIAPQPKPQKKQSKPPTKPKPRGPRLNADKLLSELEGLKHEDFDRMLQKKIPKRMRVGNKVWGTLVREQEELFFFLNNH